MLSAADEEAVHYFLDGRIGFGDIHRIVQSVLDRHESFDASTPEAVLEAGRMGAPRGSGSGGRGLTRGPGTAP